MQKRLKQMDAHTGEILEDGTLVYLPPKYKNAFQKGWIAMNQENAYLSLIDANSSGSVWRVWGIILTNTGFENEVTATQKEMADRLGMAPSNFSSAMSELVKMGLVLKMQKKGRNMALMVNPKYGWKGKGKNHQAAVDATKGRVTSTA